MCSIQYITKNRNEFQYFESCQRSYYRRKKDIQKCNLEILSIAADHKKTNS